MLLSLVISLIFAAMTVVKDFFKEDEHSTVTYNNYENCTDNHYENCTFYIYK